MKFFAAIAAGKGREIEGGQMGNNTVRHKDNCTWGSVALQEGTLDPPSFFATHGRHFASTSCGMKTRRNTKIGQMPPDGF